MRDNPPPGSQLASRSGNRGIFRYTITRGDTISTIAERYGVSSRSLKTHNGLSSDKIRIGQVLEIPGEA